MTILLRYVLYTLQEIQAIQDVDNGANMPKGLAVLSVLLLGMITILF